MGEVLHGDSCPMGNDARDLLIEIFRISDTGNKEIFPWEFFFGIDRGG